MMLSGNLMGLLYYSKNLVQPTGTVALSKDVLATKGAIMADAVK